MDADRYYELAVLPWRDGNRHQQHPLGYVKAALDTCKAKVRLFTEVQEFADSIQREHRIYEPARRIQSGEQTKVAKAARRLCAHGNFDAASLEGTLKQIAGELGSRPVCWCIRSDWPAPGDDWPSLYHCWKCSAGSVCWQESIACWRESDRV